MLHTQNERIWLVDEMSAVMLCYAGLNAVEPASYGHFFILHIGRPTILL